MHGKDSLRSPEKNQQDDLLILMPPKLSGISAELNEKSFLRLFVEKEDSFLRAIA
jgi:hypothetical protein